MIFQGLSMSFLTQLDRSSHPFVERTIKENVFTNVPNINSILTQAIPQPSKRKCVHVQGYWLNSGTENTVCNEQYVLTDSVKKNLKDLARVVSGGWGHICLSWFSSNFLEFSWFPGISFSTLPKWFVPIFYVSILVTKRCSCSKIIELW